MTDAPVLIIGGRRPDPVLLADCVARTGRIVAVDGGADHALAAGLTPALVVGDMDSISAPARAAFADRLVPIEEQETTDFDKALRTAAAPLALAVGVSGGLVDHMLAVCTVLARHPDRPCIVAGRESCFGLVPPELALDLPVGSPLSLYPLGPVRCASEGLVWPTEGLDFAPDGRIGTSNAVAGPVRLRPSGPRMLLILPRAALDAYLTGWVAQLARPGGGRWPARAGS